MRLIRPLLVALVMAATAAAPDILRAQSQPAPLPDFVREDVLVENDTGLVLTADEESFIVKSRASPYLVFQEVPEDGAERWRAGYIHPLYAPSGAILTENAPEDHIHHRGIFAAWRRILVDGEPIGDSWDGTNVYPSPGYSRVWGITVDDEIFFKSSRAWFTDIAGEPEAFMRETTTVEASENEKDLTRTIQIETELEALMPGLQLGGTNDEKGYGGLSFRFAHPDTMLIESDGETLTATNAAMQTGETVTFTWQEQDVPSDWPASISVSCKVEGKPWTNWVLRQSLSMQNCAWPGTALADIPMDRPVTLSARIVITQ